VITQERPLEVRLLVRSLLICHALTPI